jgi:hypothetical protein
VIPKSKSLKDESNLFKKYIKQLEHSDSETISHGIKKQLQNLDNIGPTMPDQIQEQALGIRQWLLDAMPKLREPNAKDMLAGKVPSEPVNKAEVVQWNRWWDMANDPYVILSWLANKTLTTKDVDFMKANFTGMWMEMSEKLLDELDKASTPLTHKEMLLLSRFTGIDLAHGLKYGALLVGQGAEQAPPGGGMSQAPKKRGSKIKPERAKEKNQSPADMINERLIQGS